MTMPMNAAMLLEDMLPKPKKRGRPPKRDYAAEAREDAEKKLKQLQTWGLPMPFMPFMPTASDAQGGATGEHGDQHHELPKEDDAEEKTSGRGRPLGSKAGQSAKKKTRGTGKPRGRPRTRPRPGEVIHRAKPPPIAPANYLMGYNYSMMATNAQKNAGEEGSGNSAGSAGAEGGANDDHRGQILVE